MNKLAQGSTSQHRRIQTSVLSVERLGL